LRHPDSHVDLFCMEPGAGGHCKVMIVVDLANVLAVITPANEL
jgi:hypothetical protein